MTNCVCVKVIRELSSLQSALDNDELERLQDQLKEAVCIIPTIRY